MHIVTYTSQDAAPAQRGLAMIYVDGERLPVIWMAETAEEAAANAQKQFDSDLAKAASAKPRGRPKKAVADSGQAAEVEADEEEPI